MNKLGTFAVMLLLLMAIGASQRAHGQSKIDKTLTEHLRELSKRCNVKISFSPSFTDKIYLEQIPPRATKDPIKALTELLKNSGMTFKRIGVTYTIIKEPWRESVNTVKIIESRVDTVAVEIEPHREIAAPALSPPVLMLPSIQIVMPSLSPIFTVAREPVERRNWLAIKTNLLYGAYALTPNLGIEIGLGRRTTLDISGCYNWFNLNGTRNDNKKLGHWIVQPEFRYFLHERFRGHFFGVHALYSQYNIGGRELPVLLGKGSADFRHHGWAIGTGVSYGYQLRLVKRWNMEFSAGLGYVHLRYNKYACPKCGFKISEENKKYFGPTKAAISLIYMIK